MTPHLHASRIVVPLFIAAIAVLRPVNPAAASEPTATSASPAIGPWLARHCGECHAGGSEEGGVSFEGVKAFKDLKADVWAAVHEQVQLSLMPPADAEQPSAAERAAVLAWMEGSMRAAGHHVSDKLTLPNYGNYVPHDPLFRGPAHPAPATPTRVWRLRPGVYAGRVGGTQPFAFRPGQQVMDYASLYEVDESAAEMVLSNAQSLVETWVTGQFKSLLDPRTEPAAAAIDSAVQQAYVKAMDRQPTPEEAGNVREAYAEVLAAHGRERAVRAMLVYPFLQPEAYYRLEIGSGDPDAHGRRRLSKSGIVAAIQQALFGNVRPEPLAAALGDPKVTLGTKDEVATLVRGLLDAVPPGGANAEMTRFIDEYFDYRKSADVFKDNMPDGFGSEHLPKGVSLLLTKIVAEDRDVLRRLLTTREAWVMNRGVGGVYDAAIYNLPPDLKETGFVTLDPTARCGILTQPAWLVAHSSNFDNDPVRRGKWILEHLLGGTVPDVPITVCAKVPEDPDQTLRDRFRVVSDDAYCWKCHEQMNQLGMPFEAYDHWGRHRLRELRKPVDASGAIVRSGDPSIDGPVKDAVELIERLAKSKRVEEVFVRYAFRFFLGRNETLRDAQTLRDAHTAYVTSQGSMKALVASLLASDSFLYRFEK